MARIRTAPSTREISLPEGAELVAALLGIPGVSLPPMSGELRLERTIEVLVSWVCALSRARPLVMLVEDLHWCDPTTIDTLTLLLSDSVSFRFCSSSRHVPSSNPRGKGPI